MGIPRLRPSTEHRGPGILDEAALAVLVLDAQGTIVDAYGDVTALLGLRLEGLVGMPAAEALRRGGVVAPIPRPGDAAVAELDGRRVELRMLSGDGASHQILVALDHAAHTRQDAEARKRVRQFQLMSRQIPGAAWTTDRDLHITDFLGDVERNLGIAHAQIIGLKVHDIAQTRDPSDPATAAHFAALRGESTSFRYPLRERWYEVHVEPLRDEAGVITGCIAAAVDVTKRREFEERVVVSEAHLAQAQQRSISLLEATIESTADGILVVDRNGKVVTYNKRFAALWRIPRAIVDHGDDTELLEFVIGQLADPDAFLQKVRDLYDRPEAESLDTLRFTDGRVFERYSRPQRVDGVLVGRVWSFRDVTERERLLQDAVFLGDVSRLLTTLDAETALDGVARLMVPALGDGCAIDLVGVGSPRRLIAISRDPARQIHTEIAAPVLAMHSVLREVGGSSQMVVPLIALGRVVGAITVTAPPQRQYAQSEIELVEEVARRSAIALENSRLYRAAQEGVRAREEFLAVAAHEIRGPIATIRLAVDALRQDLAPPKKLIGVIDREERRLARLVDELLDLGRVHTGQLHFDIEPVDLAMIVREVATRMSGELNKSGSTLSIHSESEVIGNWDRLRLDQVVGNLVSNAIKFGLGRPIEVTVEKRDHRAILTVTDHGIGIRPEMQRAIFEPFERAVPARHYGGLGLGLYIVRTIAVGLGGTIELRSAPDAGSMFIVELPMEREE